MKRIMVPAVIASVSLASASAFVINDRSAFGEQAVYISKQDAITHAHHCFDKIDVDSNGVIDIDEYAAQTVVFAELARLNRLVTLESAVLHYIDLPADAPKTLSPQERTAIDAYARQDYYRWTENGEALSPTSWLQASMASFEKADRNHDGQLSGRELTGYARIIARTGNIST